MENTPLKVRVLLVVDPQDRPVEQIKADLGQYQYGLIEATEISADAWQEAQQRVS